MNFQYLKEKVVFTSKDVLRLGDQNLRAIKSKWATRKTQEVRAQLCMEMGRITFNQGFRTEKLDALASAMDTLQEEKAANATQRKELEQRLQMLKSKRDDQEQIFSQRKSELVLQHKQLKMQQSDATELGKSNDAIKALNVEQKSFSDEFKNHITSLSGNLKQLNHELDRIEKCLREKYQDFGYQVWLIRPQIEGLEKLYEKMEIMDSQLIELQNQQEMLTEQIASSGTKTRNLLYGFVCVMALILLFIAAYLFNQFSSSGPTKAAEEFIHAWVKRDYEKLLKKGIPNISKNEVTLFLMGAAILDKDLNTRHGGLKSGKVLRELSNDSQIAKVLVVWRFEKADEAEILTLTKVEKTWIVNDGNLSGFQGKLKGNTFYYDGSLSNPIPGIVPKGFDLTLDLKESDVAATATVKDLEINMEFTKNTVIRKIPFGNYKIGITAPGFKDNFISVKAKPSSFPGRLEVNLGEPLDFDKNNDLLQLHGQGHFLLARITDTGVENVWSQSQNLGAIRGKSKDNKSIYFFNQSGIGSIDRAGQKKWDWEQPKFINSDKYNKISLIYRPDLKEAVYVNNNDVYSLQTVPDSKPGQWTQTGISNRIMGWVDNDTLAIVKTGWSNTIIFAKRDGSSYLQEGDIKPIFNNDGYITLLYSRGKIFAPGSNTLNQLFAASSNYYSSLSLIDWTSDGKFLIFHTDTGNATRVIAINTQGSTTDIAKLAYGYYNYGNIKMGAICPKGDQFAIACTGEKNAGIYWGEAGSRKWLRLSSKNIDSLFWVEPEAIIYVVKDGPDMGTWRLPTNGSKPEMIFAYRAEFVTALPDGRLLIQANNTNWLYDGKAKALGEPGKAISLGYLCLKEGESSFIGKFYPDDHM